MGRMTRKAAGRIESARARLADLDLALARGGDARRIFRERGRLSPLVAADDKRRELGARVAQAENELTQLRSEPELRALAEEELRELRAEFSAAEDAVRKILAPGAEEDARGCLLEIRAAVGGNESCLFAAALLRMYSHYAEARKWRMEQLSASFGEAGGFKEVITRVDGEGAYGVLKYESGAHRVQRVPATESQGRVHTSVVTVAVLAEARADDDAAELAPGDLRVETFRSSGAGGQHVNTTDSAVRITHLPTGICAECQDERSQHKNREKARAVLRARIADARRREQTQKESAARRLLVGSGDRSERIRTYNFPQGRLTDHRIGLTLYKLSAILDGDIGGILAALAKEDYAEQGVL